MSTINKIANASVCFSANVLSIGVNIVKDSSHVVTEACNLSVAGLLTIKNASHRKLGDKNIKKRSFGDNYKAVHDLDYRRSQIYDGRASVSDYINDVLDASGVTDIIDANLEDLMKKA